MGCVGLAGGTSSIWFSSEVMLMGQKATPDKVAQGMPDPPLDPPSRFPFRKDQPSTLRASGYANKDDLSGPPSLEGWQFFWSWWQMASDMMDGQPKHFSHMRPSLQCTVCRWLMMVPSFWPSFPHQGQWISLLKWHSASGLYMPTNPISFGDLDRDTTLKNFSPFGKVLRA